MRMLVRNRSVWGAAICLVAAVAGLYHRGNGAAQPGQGLAVDLLGHQAGGIGALLEIRPLQPDLGPRM